MSVGVGKLSNEYADFVLDIDAPKTVWMAIAVSFAMRLSSLGIENATFEDAARLCRSEWMALHENGIVPQKPPKDCR